MANTDVSGPVNPPDLSATATLSSTLVDNEDGAPSIAVVPAYRGLGDPVKQIIVRQMDRSGNTLALALEPLSDDEFYAENANGFSAAWAVGHLACVYDLFSSWFNDRRLLFDPSFHKVFNETEVVGPDSVSKAASVDRDSHPKAILLLRLRQAHVRALQVLSAFDAAQWDAPAPRTAPAVLPTCGSVWEHLAVHTYWHLGELAGSMPRFFGTYTLNIVPHHFYPPPESW